MDSSRPTDRDDGTAAERAAADWLARRDGGAWTADDTRALQAWLAQDSAHRVAFLRIGAAWDEAGRLAALGAGQPAGSGPPPRGHWTSSVPPGDALQHPPATEPRELVFRPRPPRRPAQAPAWVAAALAACTMALLVGLGWQAYDPAERATYATPLGDVRDVPLADGSRTTLASDTRLDVRLSRHERHIDLRQGEAFFEAAKDPGRPFVVAAGARRVVAVGTRFSVRRDGPDLRVVVTEGLVRLESEPVDGKPLPAALLPAGSVAVARREGVLVRSMPLAEAAQLVDWRSGLLVFHDTSLAEAATEFNRFNARKIVIGDNAVGDLRIGGSFRWANAEGFVRLLEQGFPVRAEYDDDRIVLHSP